MIEALSVGVAFYNFVMYLRSWFIRWEIHRHWTRQRFPDGYWKHPPDIDGMIGPVYGLWWRYG